MTETQQALTQKAHRAVRDAQVLMQNNSPDKAINREYYAAFYMALAALLLHDESPETHIGTHRRFFLHFVKTERLPTSIGRILSDAWDLQQKADYDAFGFVDETSASELVYSV